ncbi:tyrosine-type recombinase/integrase [Mesorhizobium japonicum]|uniref:tyrosine-type recombinase/integrase n=1 Tax=Mesorhizobium japonicum TaxID=2066070 RepID=UPI001FCC6065|nr:site-specific integrase [Mesorhizobium japonicum]
MIIPFIRTVRVKAMSQSAVELNQASSLRQLLEKFGDSLWNDGAHRTNVFSFILEANEILLNCQFQSFSYTDLEKIHSVLHQRGNSVATINRKTMALSKLLRAALKAGSVKAIPEFRKLEEPPERIRFLTDQEELSIFNHLREISIEYYELSVVLVDTGAKTNEIINLKWEDISADIKEIHLSRGKGRYERTIPASSRLIEILAPIKKKASGPGPFSGIEQHKYRAAWNEAKVRAGLGDEAGVVPYVLRHTCASRLVQGGVDLRRVQLWLGHRTLKMTMRYDYLSTNHLDICVSVLNSRHSSRGVTAEVPARGLV